MEFADQELVDPQKVGLLGLLRLELEAPEHRLHTAAVLLLAGGEHLAQEALRQREELLFVLHVLQDALERAHLALERALLLHGLFALAQFRHRVVLVLGALAELLAAREVVFAELLGELDHVDYVFGLALVAAELVEELRHVVIGDHLVCAGEVLVLLQSFEDVSELLLGHLLPLLVVQLVVAACSYAAVFVAEVAGEFVQRVVLQRHQLS